METYLYMTDVLWYHKFGEVCGVLLCEVLSIQLHSQFITSLKTIGKQIMNTIAQALITTILLRIEVNTDHDENIF